MGYSEICHLQAWIIRRHGRETDGALSSLYAMMVAECERDPEHWRSRGWWSLYDAAVERDPDWRAA